MTKTRKSVLIALSLSPLAAGCATTASECDPGRADFFKNTSCLASGAYDQRQADLQRDLAAEQQRNRGFNEVLAALEEEKAGVRSNLESRQSQYAKVDRAWQDLRRDLERGHSRNAALERQIASIDRQMARRKAAGPAESELKIRERDDLERRLSLLQREVDAGVYE